MKQHELVLNSLPVEGLSLDLDDSALWSGPVEEFGLSCQFVKPMYASITVYPQENGCLIRGRIQGQVIVPCNRCAEEASIVIDQEFDEFEEYPTPDNDNPEVEYEDSPLVHWENGVPILDLGALVWEEFSLALPVKPLCKQNCLGVCSVCGKNLNQGDCGCERSEGDSRLTALRNIKLSS